MKAKFLFAGAIGLVCLSSCSLKKKGTDSILVPSYPKLIGIPTKSTYLKSKAKVLRIPGLVGGFNPGFAPYKGGYLMTVRVKPSLGPDNRVITVRLGTDYQVIGPVRELVTEFGKKELDSVHDARLFYFRQTLWIIFSMIHSERRSSERQMFAGPLEEMRSGAFRMKKSVHLSVAKSGDQKNWSPFEYEGELYFVYYVNPHIILKANMETGECEELKRGDEVGVKWAYGSARGGTQTLRLGNKYIAAFHSSRAFQYLNGVRDTAYFMGFYTFQAHPPFMVVAHNEHPIDSSLFYDAENPRKIVFPTGLHVSGDRVIVLSGKNDDAMIVNEFALDDVLDSMTERPNSL